MSEDTQPHAAGGEDTSATPTLRQPGSLRQRGRWLLLSIIVLTSCTLAITLLLLIRSLPGNAISKIQTEKRITILRADAMQDIVTEAETLADLLREEQILVPPDAALSHALDAALVDGMSIIIKPSHDVTIKIKEDRRVFSTPLDNPLEILESAGIAVSSSDKIWVNGALAHYQALPDWTVPTQHIEIRRSLRLHLLDDGEPSDLLTTADTVADALIEADITLHRSDRVTPSLDSPIVADATITIERAFLITLKMDGVLIETRTNAERVDALLAELGASLFGLDYVLPPGDTAVSKDMLIEIVRVTEELVAQSEIIPFGIRYEADAGMTLDETAVVRTGQDGTREIRSLLRYENGVEVSRVLSATVISEPPQDQVIHYGTNIVPRRVYTPQGPRSYWRKLCMLATSYHPAALGGDDVTAIGWTLAKGIVAADPKLIRYRTEIFVPGYGMGTMADTGGPRSSPYWIDLGYSDDDWVSWRRYVNVYLLEPAPAEINYLLPGWTANRNYAGSCTS